MELALDIAVRKTTHSRLQEVDFEHLEFGQYTADHMLVCDYDKGDPITIDPMAIGWQQPAIIPFANLSMNPATLALHYGQSVFEGMKAFRMQNGWINIFRVTKHYERFARSLDRMCMAVPTQEIFTEGLMKLIEVDKEWVPKQEGAALYIRPFVYASETKFGVKVSEQYRLVIFSGPVPSLFAKPIKVKVETEYIRAAKGGTGFTKCAGNYGGAFYPTQLARQQGYDQVLWTDGRENKYIEESGMMNALFVINDKLVTAPLSDSILDGVTRDSLLTLARDLGYEVEERPVSVDELIHAFQSKTITEAFGAGTAAVVAPIQVIGIKGVDYHLPAYNDRSVHNVLKQKLERIRSGADPDVYGWNHIV